MTLENCVRPRFNCTSFKGSAVLYPINSTYNFVLSVPFEYAMLIDFNRSHRHWEGKNGANYLFKAEQRLKYLLKCWLHISKSAPASFSRGLSSSNEHLRGQSPRLNSQGHAHAPAIDYGHWEATTPHFSFYITSDFTMAQS